MAKRAVLYARVSGDDRGNEGRNLEGQIKMCREHAVSKGWRVVAELAEDERGASGAELNLPKLTELRDMARQGLFDMLVVREIDRLARSLPKQLYIEDELKRAGVQIEYVLGEYEDTPEGNLLKNMRAVVAEFERLKIVERMVRGREQSVRAGNVFTSGRPSYGYKQIQKEDGTNSLGIVDEEAAIVRLIFRWFVEGDESGKPLALRGIARKLTSMGVPTWAQLRREIAHFRNTRFDHWNSDSIRKMLRNRLYIGDWRFRKQKKTEKGLVATSEEEQIPVAVPAIVDVEIWEAAQKRLETNRQNSPRNRKNYYLFSGRIFCGICSRRMYGKTIQRDTGPHAYYTCHGK